MTSHIYCALSDVLRGAEQAEATRRKSIVDKYIGAHPGAEIKITSGEGEQGTSEVYTGKRTVRAIKMRLTRERCSGDRWARATIYMHTNDYGDAHMDIESGDYVY